MADVAFAIADAVKATIDLIAFETSPSLVVVRKTDTHHKEDTTPAIIITCKQDEEAGWATTGDGGEDFGTVGRGYTVTISIYRAFTGAAQTNNDNSTTWAMLIRQALNKPYLNGVDSVFDTEVMPMQIVETGLLGKGTDKVILTIRFKTSEARNG